MSTVVTPSADGGGELTRIGAMLDEQGDLSAVERFSRFHEREKGLPHGGMSLTLLPAASPSLNGPDELDARREVGLIAGAAAVMLGELAEQMPGGLAS